MSIISWDLGIPTLLLFLYAAEQKLVKHQVTQDGGRFKPKPIDPGFLEQSGIEKNLFDKYSPLFLSLSLFNQVENSKYEWVIRSMQLNICGNSHRMA